MFTYLVDSIQYCTCCTWLCSLVDILGSLWFGLLSCCTDNIVPLNLYWSMCPLNVYSSPEGLCPLNVYLINIYWSLCCYISKPALWCFTNKCGQGWCWLVCTWNPLLHLSNIAKKDLILYRCGRGKMCAASMLMLVLVSLPYDATIIVVKFGKASILCLLIYENLIVEKV